MERRGMILFLVMRNDARAFMSNYETHREFARVLEEAHKKGVDIRAALLKPKVDDGCLKEFDRYLPLTSSPH